MSRIGLTTGAWVIAGYLFVFGVGLGLVMQVLVVAVQNAVPYEQLGTATSGATFFRMIGGSFGTAVFGAIFANLLATNVVHALHLKAVPPQSQQLAQRGRPEVAQPPASRGARRGGGGHGAHHPDRVPHRRAHRRGGVRVVLAPPRHRAAQDGAQRRSGEGARDARVAHLARRRSSCRWSGSPFGRTGAELYTTLAARAGLELDARPCWLLYRFADRPDCTLESVASRFKVDPERIEDGHRGAGGERVRGDVDKGPASASSH